MFTTIRCKTCGKSISRYKGHIGKAERLKRIRNHYKKHHPSRFKKSAKKMVKTKKEKGIIKKSGSIPLAMLRGLVKKYRPEIIKILKEI